MKKTFAPLSVAAGILAAFSLAASAQTNVYTVTNVVTVLVTNIITVTNVVTAAPPVKPAAPEKPPGWESSTGVGLTLTRGNSDTVLVTANIQTQKKTPFDEYNFSLEGSYGKNESIKNNEALHGIGQYNHLFTERFFGYLHADALHDGIADLDYRLTISPGVGYYLLKETNTTLALETGPAVIIERLGGRDDSYATWRVAERFEHKFASLNTRVWQKLEILPQLNQLDNYLVNAEVGLEAGITKKTSLQAVLQDTYANQPAPGRKANDLKLISGVKYRF